MKRNIIILLCSIFVLYAANVFFSPSWTIDISPNLEDITDTGERYNPSTQSFLRGHHWLESIKKFDLSINSGHSGSLHLKSNSEKKLSLHNIRFDLLVPRLHYSTQNPDEFDAFNIMMAEYSRNGLNIPTGKSGDQIAHFQSNLQDSVPWKLKKDYQFEPNPHFRPLRIGVTNNCLNPGLWELNATDRAGEIYHSWFSMPRELYIDIVAETNSLPQDFVRNSLEWSEKEVQLKLDRLRQIKTKLAKTDIKVIDGPIGFSTQDSRRKLHGKYVQIMSKDGLKPPKTRRELLKNPVLMSDFVAPGKYSLQKQKKFSLGYLDDPRYVEIFSTRPKTYYNMKNKTPIAHNDAIHLEFNIHLHGKRLIIGNLPLPLIVQQEDFVIHGFGVGVLSASGLPERRALLIEKGPHPSYAYLTNDKKGKLYAVNSHLSGVEQVFIRCYPHAVKPYWEITISSFERIVDIVKYRIEIPSQLQKICQKHTQNYITPIYFSYRDDNLR
ncbi:hypothetical protein [Candidatus Uabimicrobium sp. HlEnr_7]|uniref:hypothetical protein n=1 Tax=Candidatus Uabimicrobium helgolandensis TaxID=3095367 RepID=UPI0035565E48